VSTEEQSKKFHQSLNRDATITRETNKGEGVKRANSQLNDIGEGLNPHPGTDFKYQGSAAVHIYWNETLQQLTLISQVNTLKDTNELVAQAAFKDLTGAAIAFYGKRRPKMRSGF